MQVASLCTSSAAQMLGKGKDGPCEHAALRGGRGGGRRSMSDGNRIG